MGEYQSDKYENGAIIKASFSGSTDTKNELGRLFSDMENLQKHINLVTP